MARSPGMRCKELVELVTEYLEERLSALDRVRFEMHIAKCGPCRRYLEQMRITIAALGGLTPGTIEPAARDTLLSIFRDWKQESPGPG